MKTLDQKVNEVLEHIKSLDLNTEYGESVAKTLLTRYGISMHRDATRLCAHEVTESDDPVTACLFVKPKRQEEDPQKEFNLRMSKVINRIDPKREAELGNLAQESQRNRSNQCSELHTYKNNIDITKYYE